MRACTGVRCPPSEHPLPTYGEQRSPCPLCARSPRGCACSVTALCPLCARSVPALCPFCARSIPGSVLVLCLLCVRSPRLYPRSPPLRPRSLPALCSVSPLLACSIPALCPLYARSISTLSPLYPRSPRSGPAHPRSALRVPARARARGAAPLIGPGAAEAALPERDAPALPRPAR